MLSTTAANKALDALGITTVSAHSAYPGDTGANELAGGTYARKGIGYAAAAAKSMSSNAQPVLDIPGGATVAWIGRWDAAPAYMGCAPVGGSPKEYTVDVAANRIQVDAHGLVAGDKVVFFAGSAPGGIVEGDIYYVVSPTANDFQVAAAEGGAATDLTAKPGSSAQVSKIVPETYASAGTFQVTADTVALTF